MVLSLGNQIRDKYEFYANEYCKFRYGLNAKSQLSHHFLLANDGGTYDYVNQLYLHLGQLSKDYSSIVTTKNRVALVVGNFYLLSIIDKLPYSTILSCDIDPLVFEFLIGLRTQIITLDADSTLSFEEKKQSLLKYVEDNWKKINPGILIELDKEQRLFGAEHYLSSEKRFSEIAAILKTVEFISIIINLFDYNQIFALEKSLRETATEIDLFYLTNLRLYDKQSMLSVNLIQLPSTAKPYILSACTAQGGGVESSPAFGLKLKHSLYEYEQNFHVTVTCGPNKRYRDSYPFIYSKLYRAEIDSPVSEDNIFTIYLEHIVTPLTKIPTDRSIYDNAVTSLFCDAMSINGASHRLELDKSITSWNYSSFLAFPQQVLSVPGYGNCSIREVLRCTYVNQPQNIPVELDKNEIHLFVVPAIKEERVKLLNTLRRKFKSMSQDDLIAGAQRIFLITDNFSDSFTQDEIAQFPTFATLIKFNYLEYIDPTKLFAELLPAYKAIKQKHDQTESGTTVASSEIPSKMPPIADTASLRFMPPPTDGHADSNLCLFAPRIT